MLSSNMLGKIVLARVCGATSLAYKDSVAGMMSQFDMTVEICSKSKSFGTTFALPGFGMCFQVLARPDKQFDADFE